MMTSEWKEVATLFWKPDKDGDAIEGRVIGVETTQYGEAYKIDTKDGVMLVNYTALSTSLSSLLPQKDEDPQEVRIVYKGEKVGATGRTYKNFKVFKK